MVSTATPDTGGSPAAPRAGADLRAARERVGWSIEDVSHALRIRQPHLEALEEGRIELLPGSAYAVGFLRIYAKTLGLDPDEIVRRFKAEAQDVDRRIELVFPAPMPQRGLPAGAVVLLGVVLVIAAYAGWYRLSGEGRLPAEAVMPVPQRLAPLAEQAPPVHPPEMTAQRSGSAVNGAVSTPNPTLAATAPTAASTTAAAAGPVAATGQQLAVASPSTLAPQPAPMTAISPTSAAAAPVPLIVLSPRPAPPTTPPSEAASAASSIVLQATADAWLEVRDHSGAILLNRVLHKGDSWTVPSQPDLTLTTGNAGGTEIVVDGMSYPVAGGTGAVRRDLSLDPGLIKAGRLSQAGPGATASGPAAVAPVAFARPATR